MRPDAALFWGEDGKMLFCDTCEHWVLYTSTRAEGPTRMRCLGDFGQRVVVVDGVEQRVPYLSPTGGHMLEWDP